MRDEERYAVVLEHIMADMGIDEVYKTRPAFQLEEINKNTAGTVDNSDHPDGSGKMRVLALYPGEDMEEWKACAPEPPSAWLNGRDASAGLNIKNRLYAIRDIPSLYLLDKNKRVLLKDADYIRLEAWLQNTD